MAAALDAYSAWTQWLGREVGHENRWVKEHPGAWKWVEYIRSLGSD